jgi:hypothetical protein
VFAEVCRIVPLELVCLPLNRLSALQNVKMNIFICKKKTREAASLGPVLGGHQYVYGNDSGAERNEDKESPRKSARIAMAKNDDGPSYFDVLSNELVVNIFHMLTGGADPAVPTVPFWKRWSEAGREEEKKVAGRYMSVIALSSSCTRMRAIESEMRYPLLRIVLPLNEDEDSMSSFMSYLLREERRFDRIIVICSESASLNVLRDLRNATKEIRLPPDDMSAGEPKIGLHFPTIGGNYDETTLIESMLLKHIHDELSTNGPQIVRLMIELKTALENEQTGDVMARTNKEMRSLGYMCEDQSHIENGRVVARNLCFGNGFVCSEQNQRGEQNQREVTINFIVYLNNIYKPNCGVQLVTTRRYSEYASGMTQQVSQVSWHENQSTWLGIALRLYRHAIGWEDAECDTDDTSKHKEDY